MTSLSYPSASHAAIVKSLILSHIYHSLTTRPNYDIVVIPLPPCSVQPRAHHPYAYAALLIPPPPPRGRRSLPHSAHTLPAPSHPAHTPGPSQRLTGSPHAGPLAPRLAHPYCPPTHPLDSTTTQTPLHTHRLRGSHTAHTPPLLTIMRGVRAVPTLQNRIEKLCAGPTPPDRPYPTCDNFEIAILNWVSKLGPGARVKGF